MRLRRYEEVGPGASDCEVTPTTDGQRPAFRWDARPGSGALRRPGSGRATPPIPVFRPSAEQAGAGEQRRRVPVDALLADQVALHLAHADAVQLDRLAARRPPRHVA